MELCIEAMDPIEPLDDPLICNEGRFASPPGGGGDSARACTESSVMVQSLLLLTKSPVCKSRAIKPVYAVEHSIQHALNPAHTAAQRRHRRSCCPLVSLAGDGSLVTICLRRRLGPRRGRVKARAGNAQVGYFAINAVLARGFAVALLLALCALRAREGLTTLFLLGRLGGGIRCACGWSWVLSAVSSSISSSIRTAGSICSVPIDSLGCSDNTAVDGPRLWTPGVRTRGSSRRPVVGRLSLLLRARGAGSAERGGMRTRRLAGVVGWMGGGLEDVRGAVPVVSHHGRVVGEGRKAITHAGRHVSHVHWRGRPPTPS